MQGDDVPRTDSASTGGASLESEAPAAGTRVATGDAMGPSDSKAREPVPHEAPELVTSCARLRSLPRWCVERERVRVRERGTP